MKTVFMVDGYEMVGKSTFINNVLGKCPNIGYYKSRYDIIDTEFTRDDLVLLGFGFYDVLGQSSSGLNKDIIIDRAILSSVLYNKMYYGGQLENSVLTDRYLSNIKYLRDNEIVNTVHIYVEPLRLTDAERMWKHSKTNRDYSDIYDDKSLDTYLDNLKLFNSSAKEFYNNAGELEHVYQVGSFIDNGELKFECPTELLSLLQGKVGDGNRD